MKLIVGLGNPGKEYLNTRHNIGFMVLDKFTSGAWREDKKIELIKPDTFMNDSGKAVGHVKKKAPRT